MDCCSKPGEPSSMVKDPVCGMTVDPAESRFSLTYHGIHHHFCSAGCLAKFEKTPQHYVDALGLEPAKTSQQVIDPVCGMRVDPATSPSTHYEGKTYHFCGKSCAAKFAAAPANYLHGKPAPKASPSAAKEPHAEYICPMDPEVHQLGPGACPKCGMALEPATITAPATRVEYTCPMHPEIARDKPGACPICGMALEPKTVTAADANPELESMTRRLVIGGALTLPLLVIMVLDVLPGAPLGHLMHGPGLGYLELLLSSPVVLWAGWPFFQRGWASVISRNLNMFTLIAIGSGSAYLYSVMAVALPQVFPASFRDHAGQVGLYFEAAAVITVLVLLGQVLELRARSQTSGAIKALLGLAPNTARRIAADGTEHDVDLAELQLGDRLRVRPGERVPTDGVVLEGRSNVDESMITGEPTPVAKSSEARVTGGTINGTGSFVMRTERVGADTLLAQIVKMVSEAQRTRAPIQRVADVVASYFVPAVLAAALFTFIAWAIYGPEPRYAHALISAVAVLIIACPCALGLATPMAIMVGTGRAAHEGVLIRNAEALEALEKVDILVVDKTGTLTAGKPTVVGITAAAGFDEAQVLETAASLERGSEHPLAAAILAAAAERQFATSSVEHFESLTGRGIRGVLHGEQVAIGNRTLLEDLGASAEVLEAHAEAARADGQTVMYVVIAGRLAGFISVADPIKESTPEAIAELKRSGLRIVMVTGDSHTTAEVVARQLGIEFEAGVMPASKADVIRKLQHAGARVAMAGDGVNDAPALAQANVGIAMGTGTDVAIKTGGITLINGDLRGIVRARRLSQLTMSNIRQNLFFAFFYNALGIPLAAGVLFPVFGLLLSPMIAAAAMSFSSVSVIANALRLRAAKL